jgi:hypothetical protein
VGVAARRSGSATASNVPSSRENLEGLADAMRELNARLRAEGLSEMSPQ